MGSLLEVGTGFHPELTGRENVYFNGAILGMRKQEIEDKFEEIVKFAEIEKFLDTPVKRYSSGMYVRLAFAVAAHMDPEILAVDEVLAVGDVGFQKKCLGKMDEVAEGGRTVLFVSHNMQAIRNLCPRCILLNEGKIISDAPTKKSLSIYNHYLRGINIDDKTAINNESTRRGGGTIRFTSISIQDVQGNERFDFEMGATIRFRTSYKVFKEMQGLSIYIALRSGLTRDIVTSVRHLITSEKINASTAGTVTIELPDIYIRPGEYPLYLHISESLPTKTNFDVLDDLTAPLVISAGNKQQHSNFDPLQPIGYFSIPSRIINDENYESNSGAKQ
jgi:lipopolysaccharide transport system ATP-binding protein